MMDHTETFRPLKRGTSELLCQRDGDVFLAIEQELIVAREQFRNPRNSFAALVEEVGELATALLNEAAGKVDPKHNVLIHASSHEPSIKEMDHFESLLCNVLGSNQFLFQPLPLGKILCLVDLVNIKPTEKVNANISIEEKMFGNFLYGRVALDLRNVRRFKEPWPWKGALGLFTVPDELIAMHELEAA